MSNSLYIASKFRSWAAYLRLITVIVLFILTGTVSQLVERPLCDRGVAGSIPSRVVPKTLKMVLAALSLGAQ